MSDAQTVEELLRQGRRIEAIQLLREQHDLDLIQAQAEVDRISAMIVQDEMPATPDTSIPVSDSDAFMKQMKELINEGAQIDAIQIIRDRTGLGLKEAKALVNALAEGQHVIMPEMKLVMPPASENVPKQVVDLVYEGKKMEAIALLREKTNMGLEEAKAMIDKIEGAKGKGCFSMLFLLVCTLIIAWLA